MNLSVDERIKERLEFLMELGQRNWGKQVKPHIKYNLKGSVGGMACYPNIIRVNLPLLFNNEEDYLLQNPFPSYCDFPYILKFPGIICQSNSITH